MTDTNIAERIKHRKDALGRDGVRLIVKYIKTKAKCAS